MKGNKGITLIALVITIIVLLILAGVSIAMLTGENSILKRASQASAQNQLGAANDAVSLLVADKVAEFYEEAYTKNNTTALQGGLNVYLAGHVLKGNATTEDTIVKVIDNANITVADLSVASNGAWTNEGSTTNPVFTLTLTDNTATWVSQGFVNNGKVTWSIAKQ